MEHAVEKKIIKAIKVMVGVLDEHLCSTQRTYDLAASINDLSDILKSEYNKRLIVLMPSNK
jgi:hypothetical protein